MTPEMQYGVRGPDPRNTIVNAGTREAAEDMLLPGDVLMERRRHCPYANCEKWTDWYEVSS